MPGIQLCGADWVDAATHLQDMQRAGQVPRVAVHPHELVLDVHIGPHAGICGSSTASR